MLTDLFANLFIGAKIINYFTYVLSFVILAYKNEALEIAIFFKIFDILLVTRT